jgi:hypothetical protein
MRTYRSIRSDNARSFRSPRPLAIDGSDVIFVRLRRVSLGGPLNLYRSGAQLALPVNPWGRRAWFASRATAQASPTGPSRVFACVCRHVERSAVEDIVAGTFLTAWRRTEGVPEVPLPRLLAMAAA